MRVYFFYCAIFLYAIFSSPTPDVISFIDFIIMGLLIFTIGYIAPFNVLTITKNDTFIDYMRFFILLILPYPLFIGVINGHSLDDIIRDILPFLCLLIPLCLYHANLKYLDIILAICGGVFALRYLMAYIPNTAFPSKDLLYLANSPLVCFTAIFGFGLFTDFKKIFWFKRLFGLCLSLIAFAAMASMLQRAPLGVSLLACSAIYILRFCHHPIQSFGHGLILCLPILAVSPIFSEIITHITQKTITVGANNRIEEFSAVIQNLSLFGYGWGAEWQSPAVGYIHVRYTHNMISYYLLKAGIIGGLLSLVFLILILRKSLKLIKKYPALGFALFVPFIIHGMLYTGYKTLDFSLLLTLLISWQRNDQFSYSTEHSRPRLVQREG